MTILDETYTLAGGVEIKDYDEAVASIDESLKKLGLEYIDLMLIHSPQPWDDFRGGEYAEGNRAAWRALEEAHQAGRSAPSVCPTSSSRTGRTSSRARTSCRT